MSALLEVDHDVALTPSGRLVLRTGDGSTGARGPAKHLQQAFAASSGCGLFALAAARPDPSASPAVAYWRDFASRYLAMLCRTPEGASGLAPVDPLADGERAELLLTAPPMAGGEYLSSDVLRSLWLELDAWVRDQVAAAGTGLGAWLKANAPLWHQVGRVAFHLAENKRDPEYPFAFLATYAPRLGKSGRVQYQPLSGALQEYANDRKALVKLLSPVQTAAESSAFVRDLLESKDLFHPLAWTPDEAYQLLKEVPRLEDSGLLVFLPDWWRKRPRPRVAVTVGEKKQSRVGLEAALDFRVDLAIGDQTLTEDEWRQLLAADDGLVLVKGQWVEVDREKLTQALDHWQRVARASDEEGISFIEGMRLLAGAPSDLAAGGAVEAEREWSMVRAGEWLQGVLSKLRAPEQLALKASDNGFRGTLRPYQQVGRDWLLFLSQLGLGACLADDMGLGKTVQVLSLLLALRKKRAARKPSLLVLPASLLGNWKAEMQRFAPDLTARFVHPAETPKEDLDALAADSRRALKGVDLVVTTYGMLLRQKWLSAVEWRLVILDEAQAIKNPSARQTQAVKKLKSEARIALTGTPVENRLTDLWSLFDFLSPGLLGSAKRFKGFVKSLSDQSHDGYAPLRNLVRPYLLRRLKTDKRIIADLPDKTEMRVFCGLAKRQAALYAKTVEELTRALESADGMKRRGLVLAYLMRFKQICNHPSQLLGDDGYDMADSGKFDRLRELAEEVASRQEKLLLFTQFREMTEPLATFLAGVFGRGGLILHGATNVGKRRALVEQFQQDDGPPFFVLSLKAGGTGLNLTAASHVVHFDRWWNPAVENQATDRAFRIGQHRNVMVHKFVCRGTVEEKIDALITDKTEMADSILKGGAERILTEMTDDELLKTVALDIDRAQA